MSELEPGDPLWKLLGHASKAEPSDFFAAKVALEVSRQTEPSRGAASWLAWLEQLREFLAPRPLYATAGFAAALLAVSLLALPILRPTGENTASRSFSPTAEAAEPFDPATELAAVEYLGQLMAVADPGQLEDAVLADLFF